MCPVSDVFLFLMFLSDAASVCTHPLMPVSLSMTPEHITQVHLTLDDNKVDNNRPISNI